MKLLVLALTLIPAVVFANMETEFQAIKNNGRDLNDIGAICEEVAQHQMQQKYSIERYKVLTSIAYSDLDGTVGELDIIIFDKSTNQAAIIGEVKCWRNMESGLRKARDQRSRFLSYVKSSKALTFSWLPNPSALHLTKQQFNKTNTFITIAQKGAKDHGYDVELDLTLNELMDLRSRIMACQSSGECKKVDHH